MSDIPNETRFSLSIPSLTAVILPVAAIAVYVQSERLRDWIGPGRSKLFLLMLALFFAWGIVGLIASATRPPAARNRWSLTRRRVAITRPGLVYLVMMAVMFLGSTLGGSNMLMLIFALMTGPFILNGWTVLGMLKRIRVSRSLPERVMAGEVASVELGIENRKWLIGNWMISLRDSIVGPREELRGEVVFAHVPRRQTRYGCYQMTLTQRGIYQFGPLEAASQFPLGLIERGQFFPKKNDVLVYPRLGRLSERWKVEHLQASELVERQQQRGPFDDEFHRLREYRFGDNPKSIHWRTSARQNELMVREHIPCRDQHLLVLVDFWQPEKPTAEEIKRTELAASFAATLCVEQVRESRSSRVILGIAGKKFLTATHSAGARVLNALLDILAVAQPQVGSQTMELTKAIQTQNSYDSRLIVITTRPAGSRERQDWHDKLVNDIGGLMPGNLEIIEADAQQLSSFFTIPPAEQVS